MKEKSEQSTVLAWAFLNTLGTLASRIIGLFREAAMAALFGTGMMMDAFTMALRFPNLLKGVLGENGLVVVMLPRYAQEKNELGLEHAFAFASAVSIALGLVSAAIILLGEITAPYLVWVFAHGWVNQPEKFALTVKLLRIFYPMVCLIAYSSWATAVLNAHKRFFTASLAPAFFNIGWLAGCIISLVFVPETQQMLMVEIVAVGVFFGSVLEFAIQFAQMRKIGFKFIWMLREKFPAVKQIGLLMIPALGSLAVVEINYIIDAMIASLLPEGSVSALSYANRLIFLPMGLASVALARAALPALAEHIVRKEPNKAADLMLFSQKAIFGIMFPIAAYIIALSPEIVRLVYERGSFSGNVSTPMTATALAFYAIGLPMFGGNKVLMQGFYAIKDTRTPFFLSAIVVLVNIFLNIMLMGPLAHGGLALATSIASSVHTVLLTISLSKRGLQHTKEVIQSFIRVFIASIFLLFGTYYAKILTLHFVNGTTFFERVLQLGLPSLAWLVFVIVTAKLFKLDEIDFLLNTLKRKLFSRS